MGTIIKKKTVWFYIVFHEREGNITMSNVSYNNMIWCVFFRSHLCARLPLAISIKDAVFFLSIFLHRIVITDIYRKTFFITKLFYTIIYFRVMERQWRFSTLVLYEDWRDDCLMSKPFKVFTYHMHLRLETWKSSRESVIHNRLC